MERPEGGARSEVAELFRSLPFDVMSVAKEELAAHLAASGNVLSETAAEAYGKVVGRTSRTVYRWVAELRCSVEVPEPPATWTFFDRLEHLGPGSLDMDDELFLWLYYLADGNMRLLRRDIIDAGYPMLSEGALSRRFCKQVSPMVRDGARHGLRNRHEKGLFIRRNDHRFSDEVWELDEFDLDIEVLKPRATVTSCRPHLLLLTDWESGRTRGVSLLPRHANRWDVLALLAEASERWTDRATQLPLGGPAERIVLDNAMIFRNPEVVAAFETLPTLAKFAPAFTPTAKARVEHAGGILQTKVLSSLAGRVTKATQLDGKSDAHSVPSSSLLRWDSFEQALFAGVDEYDFDDVVANRGCSRDQWYQEHARPPRRINDEDAVLASMYQSHYLRDNGRRDFNADGVQIDGLWWNGPGLRMLIGEEVQVRALAHKRHRAALFYEGKFQGWVKPTLDTAERRALVGDRYADQLRVARLTRASNRASGEVNAQLERGEDRDRVAAVKATARHRGEETTGVSASTPRRPGRRPDTVSHPRHEPVTGTRNATSRERAARRAMAEALGAHDAARPEEGVA